MVNMFILIMMLVVGSFAQAEVGADITSRYIWRGIAYGNTPAVQPSISYTKSNVTVGTWASYSVDIADSVQTENDFYVSTKVGDLDITLTDYYYPRDGYLFERDNHTFELMLNYSYFVDLTLATNVYNDDDFSPYVKIAKEVDGLTLFVGTSLTESEWYGTDEFNVIELGATASKDDLSVSYILNPNERKNYIVLTYSL